jgi:AhpD family alkylhydroperoxidase
MSEVVAPYTLSKLVREGRAQLPFVLRNAHRIPAGFVGADRIDGKTRILVQLRMARLMGCPVCVNLFPPLGRRAGLSDTAIASGLAGSPEGLTPEQLAAVTWIGELIARDGALPMETPSAARVLAPRALKHLTVMARMELVVHATGLMFLPQTWIERAAR